MSSRCGSIGGSGCVPVELDDRQQGSLQADRDAVRVGAGVGAVCRRYHTLLLAHSHSLTSVAHDHSGKEWTGEYTTDFRDVFQGLSVRLALELVVWLDT